MTTDVFGLAAQLTELAAHHSDRGDLIVRVDNDLDGYAQFDRRTAQISVNVNQLVGDGPAANLYEGSVAPAQYPALLGALAHEAGHADYTRPRRMPAAVEPWAALLEEPRMERRVLERNPELRTVLAASAATVLGESLTANPIAAMELLILLGGRALTGVFPTSLVRAPLQRALTALRDADRSRVQQIVGRAVALADDDLDALQDCAQELAQIAATYDQDAAPRTAPGHAAPTSEDNDDRSNQDEAAAADPEPVTGDHPDEVVQKFPPAYIGADPKFLSAALPNIAATDWYTVTALDQNQSTVREATAADYQAVRKIGSWVAGHHHDATVTTTVAAASPPGALRMAELVRASAQQELGLAVTALPWRRRRTLITPTVPVDVGMIVDRSHSMTSFMPAIADATWVLHHALTAGTGRSQSWVFAERAHILPATSPSHILTPTAEGTTIAMLPALLDYRRWARPHGSARLLVVISDGGLYGDPVREELARLHDEGVMVVGLAPGPQFTAALANHLPDRAPIGVVGADLLGQLAELIVTARS
ncbi:hypothetical protein ACFQNE_03120 [Gordonia phosphorivorans]|uniref:VWA domain-containing protein n=1 Tax=Gordonia phosphorivorans TaxID=1056982 RepID=A0ABV6H3W5_9ACTN